MFPREPRRRRLATAPTVGHARLGRAHPRRTWSTWSWTVISASGCCCSDRVDCTAWRTWTRSTWKVDMVPADVERRGRGRGGAAANGRLADSTAWRTWTRSTWKVDMVPAGVERRGRGRGGAAANGRLVDRSPSADPRPGLPMPQPGCVPRGCGSGFAAHDSGRELAPVWRFTGLLMSTPRLRFPPDLPSATIAWASSNVSFKLRFPPDLPSATIEAASGQLGVRFGPASAVVRS